MVVHIPVTLHLLDLLHPSPAALLEVIRLLDTGRPLVVTIHLLAPPHILAGPVMATPTVPRARITPRKDPLMERHHRAPLGDIHQVDKVDGMVLDGETFCFDDDDDRDRVKQFDTSPL